MENKVRELEGEMFLGLLRGLDDDIMMRETREVACCLEDLRGDYFDGDCVDEGLRRLFVGLKDNDLNVWEKAIDSVVSGYSMLLWRDSKLLNEFEGFLKSAPDSSYLDMCEKIISYNKHVLPVIV